MIEITPKSADDPDIVKAAERQAMLQLVLLGIAIFIILIVDICKWRLKKERNTQLSNFSQEDGKYISRNSNYTMSKQSSKLSRQISSELHEDFLEKTSLDKRNQISKLSQFSGSSNN